MTLIFHNPGEIDIRGACIAGLSAKESDSPIGYFGTGLKYSIACILRWSGSITIYSGAQKYTFEVEPIDYRGQKFQQIIMSSDYARERLGFTTEYGKNWKPWQVFRELYANARDEGGDVIFQGMIGPVLEGHTHVVVNCRELIEHYYLRHSIILPKDQQWSYQSDRVQFSNARAESIYYRGVRVYEQACCFTWNFLAKTELTEDRTLRSLMAVSHHFDSFIEQHLHDTEVLMKLFELKYEELQPSLSRVVEVDSKPHTKSERPIEAVFMNWYYLPVCVCDWHSDEFKEALKRLYQRDPTTYSKIRPYIKSLDSKLVEEKLYKLSVREQQMLNKAKELVALFGFEEEIARLPVHIQELGGNTLGLYEHGTIYLSPKLFDQGTKQLVATLYEECYHHKTQNKDCDYNTQTDLFNIIISLNEELHKVIC